MWSAIGESLMRCGDWLDRRRTAGASGLLLAFEVAGFVFFAAGTYGLIVPLKTPASTDFVSFYAAGALVNAGTPQRIYDQAAHYAAEQRATAPGIKYNYFYYPPTFALLCALLARLPYLAAFAVFQAIGFALYLLIMAAIAGERRWSALLPAVAFPPVLWNIGLGQTAFLTAVLFGAATLFVERRPLVAGLLFGLVSYKPHFGLLIPVALAAGGHWRAFTGATIAAAGLAALSLLLLGGATWMAFFAAAAKAEPVYAGIVNIAGYVTPFGAVRVLGGRPAIAYAMQFIVTACVLIVVARAWAGGATLPARAAVLCAGTIIATPLTMWYDLLLAAVASAWLHAAGKLSAAERAIIAALFILVLYPAAVARTLDLPIGPLAALAFFTLVARIGWHEAARRPAPAELASTQAVVTQPAPRD